MSAIDEIPLPEPVPGRLFAAGLSAVGPDPLAAVRQVGAGCLVTLQHDDELDQRFPAFRAWLDQSPAVDIIRFPILDWGVVDDDRMSGLVRDVVGRLERGTTVLTHCGAGMGRTGVLCTLVLVALGTPIDEAAVHVRASRAGAGPDSEAQAEQLRRLADALQPSPPTGQGA